MNPTHSRTHIYCYAELDFSACGRAYAFAPEKSWHVSNKENEQLDSNEAKIWLSYESIKSKWKTAATTKPALTHIKLEQRYTNGEEAEEEKIIRRSKKRRRGKKYESTPNIQHIFTVNRWTAQIICIQKKMRTKLTTMCRETKREKKHEIMNDRDNRSHSERNKHKQTPEHTPKHRQELCGASSIEKQVAILVKCL